jgi:CRP-like cAMP-binding protein
MQMTESTLQSLGTTEPRGEVFPVLTPAQIDRIRPYANARTVGAGEILSEAGDLGIPCFVVLSGKLNIVIMTLSGEQIFGTLVPGISRETWS